MVIRPSVRCGKTTMTFGTRNREFFIIVIGLLVGGLALWILADALLVSVFIVGCVMLLVGHAARVQQQHEQITLELEHRNQEILRLCYAMTHDLQTPLASLTGGVDALEHRLDGASPDQMKWMDRIRTSAQRMVAMLDDLMVYARMGTEEFETAPVDLCERVRVVLEELQPQAERKGVRIDCPVGNTPACKVLGDRKFMVRVLTNLIGNAVKYIDADTAGEVVVQLDVQGKFARLTVKDNGPGIAPALLDEVFQPFRRASAGTDGTGLGLSLVRRYVTAMGGRVWLESDGEHGTTAVMELPLAATGYGKRGRRAA